MKPPKVSFWLEAIRCRAGKSVPVFLIGTHLDQLKVEKKDEILSSVKNEIATLRVRFPNIRGEYFCSSASNSDVKTLKSQIAASTLDLLSQRPLISERILSLEKAVLDRASRMSQSGEVPILTWNAFRSIEIEKKGTFSLEDVMDDAEYRVAADALRDLGSLLYFGEVSSLRDIVILDPQFLASLFSQFVTFRSTFIQNGTFEESALPHILPSYPPSLYPSLLSLCSLFGVVVRLPSRAQTYLVPSMLPSHPPPNFASLWPPETSSSLPIVTPSDPPQNTTSSVTTSAASQAFSAGRRFDFAILSPGIFSHFLSHAVGVGTRETLWKSGCLVEFDHCVTLSQVRNEGV